MLWNSANSRSEKGSHDSGPGRVRMRPPLGGALIKERFL